MSEPRKGYCRPSCEDHQCCQASCGDYDRDMAANLTTEVAERQRRDDTRHEPKTR